MTSTVREWRNVCVRCRNVSGTMQVRGGHPQLFDLAFGTMSQRALCTRCGGWVYSVPDDQVLPFEFAPSWRRIARAACWTAVKAPLLWGFPALVIAVPGTSPERANIGALGWLPPLIGIAMLFGFLLPWAQARVAIRQEVNEPHRAGMLSAGEGATLRFFVVPVLVATMAIFVYVTPMLAGEHAELRGAFVRGACGLVTGVIVLGDSTRGLFRHGRRPPPEGKRWRFGEDPK